MKYVGGVFDYWWLTNMMPYQAYEDVLVAMQAEGAAQAEARQRTNK